MLSNFYKTRHFHSFCPSPLLSFNSRVFKIKLVSKEHTLMAKEGVFTLTDILTNQRRHSEIFKNVILKFLKRFVSKLNYRTSKVCTFVASFRRFNILFIMHVVSFSSDRNLFMKCIKLPKASF